MKRIIGVNTNCYHGYSVEEALGGIHSAGFHYVELTATKGWTEHVFPNQSFEYLEGLKSKMKELDLIPFALSGHCNLMDAERLSDFVMNIKLAAFFGCDYIVSSVGEAHLKDREVSSDEILIENIKGLIPYLEQFKLRLVLEIHGQHATGKILKDITDAAASPWVKINYDTANVIFHGKTDPVEDIDSCMEDIAYMHLKDKAGEATEWNFPALGKGRIEFQALFIKLQQAGNDCPFSLEIEFTKDGAGSLSAVNKAVKDSAQYLIKNGFEL